MPDNPHQRKTASFRWENPLPAIKETRAAVLTNLATSRVNDPGRWQYGQSDYAASICHASAGCSGVFPSEYPHENIERAEIVSPKIKNPSPLDGLGNAPSFLFPKLFAVVAALLVTGRSSGFRIILLARTFPRGYAKQWLTGLSSPDTAAGPRRIQTGFPIKLEKHL